MASDCKTEANIARRLNTELPWFRLSIPMDAYLPFRIGFGDDTKHAVKQRIGISILSTNNRVANPNSRKGPESQQLLLLHSAMASACRLQVEPFDARVQRRQCNYVRLFVPRAQFLVNRFPVSKFFPL